MLRMRFPTIFCCVTADRQKLADEDRMRYEGGQYYVKSERGNEGTVPNGEAVENTQRIADRCNVEIEFGVTEAAEIRCAGGTIPGAI